MKLNQEFIVHTVSGETLLVPTGSAPFRGLVEGNKTVEVILNCLQRNVTEQEIVEVLSDRFDGDLDDMREDVADVIAQLRSIGAIDD